LLRYLTPFNTAELTTSGPLDAALLTAVCTGILTGLALALARIAAKLQKEDRDASIITRRIRDVQGEVFLLGSSSSS